MRRQDNQKKASKKSPLIDYTEYHFSRREFFLELLKGLGILSITSYLFYGSLFMVVFLSPYLYFYLKMQRERARVRRQERLRDEFKEAMISMVNALYAGYSLENSLIYVREELERIHPEEEGLFVAELDYMIKKISLKVPIEQLFTDLAVRSRVEEIDLFASVIVITKRNGGNLIKIIQKTVGHLSKKLQVDNEIDILITGKKLEKNIMCIMPYFVILYMNLTNGNYMSSMYGNLIGFLLMSICLALILVAYYWADNLIKIGV